MMSSSSNNSEAESSVTLSLALQQLEDHDQHGHIRSTRRRGGGGQTSSVASPSPSLGSGGGSSGLLFGTSSSGDNNKRLSSTSRTIEGEEISQEITTRIVESSTDRKRRETIERSTKDFTINKLKYKDVGLYGREEERQILLDLLQHVVGENAEEGGRRTTTSTPTEGTGNKRSAESPAESNDSTENTKSSTSTTRREIVFIGGPSGSGKTRLATSLRPVVEGDHDGAFVVGKFDNSNSSYSSEPYKALSSACREICGKLLSEPSKKQDEIRTKILDALIVGGGTATSNSSDAADADTDGRDDDDAGGALDNCTGPANENGNRTVGQHQLIQLLVGVVPEVQEFLQTELYYEESMERKNLTAMTQQLHHVFRLFIRAICSWYRPLVMLIDDLQWADHASLELMEVLMTDRENSGLLLIGCYRSNEVVDGTHRLSKWIQKLKEMSDQDEKQRGPQNLGHRDGFGVNEIEIGYLGLEEANKIIMALLSIDDPSRTMPLAKICQKRTLGSPFFIIYLIKVWEHESYLQFNLGSLQWTWDIVQIDEDTTLTDNAVEIMMKKMESVHHDLGTLLKISSMLGSHFSKKILSIVWMKLDNQLDHQRLDECLEEALALSILESAGPDSYRWSHDKVQEAGRSLVSDAELPSFQFDIGMILLRNLSSEDLDSLIFIVVSLLNSKDCNDEALNIEIASLCSDAASKAKKLSAFDTTLRFAKIGISHLTSDRRWESAYGLTLNLFRTAAESAGILANTDEMRIFCDGVLKNGRDILDKIPVYSSLALDMGRDGRFVEAIKVCLDAINQLGVVRIRRNGISQAMVVFSNLFKTKRQLATLDADKLPIMVNPKQIQTMKLLDIICSYSFEAKSVILMLDACIKQAQLTIRHGISSAAPTALAQFGLIVSGVLNDLKVGTKIADDATSMVPRLHGNVSEALLVARTWGFMYGYSRPLHNSLRKFLYGYAEGMKFGDTEMASWCLANHTMVSFMLGKTLRTINDDCCIYIPHMKDLGWDEIAEMASSIHQAALYLMEWKEMDDSDMVLFNDLVGEPKFHQLSRPWSRIQVYAYMCDYKVGAEYAMSIGDLYMNRGPGHQSCQADVFARCVCLYAATRTTRKQKYTRKARSLMRVLQRWEKDGCMNSKHQLFLLNAEDAALGGRRRCLEALQYYEEGISASNRIGNLRDAGLISERYANFLLNDMKDEDRARFHVEQSIRYYDEWGAKRSVGMLRWRYSNILGVRKLPARSFEIAKKE